MAPKIQKVLINPNVTEFHVRVEISESVHQSFYRPLRSSSDIYLKEIGDKGAKLVKKVMVIPGVNEVIIEPYSLCIFKASTLFKWGEIEPRVEKAIKVVFGGEREEVNYLSLTEIPLSVLLLEPLKRLGRLIRNAWYRIPNLAE